MCLQSKLRPGSAWPDLAMRDEAWLDHWLDLAIEPGRASGRARRIIHEITSSEGEKDSCTMMTRLPVSGQHYRIYRSFTPHSNNHRRTRRRARAFSRHKKRADRNRQADVLESILCPAARTRPRAAQNHAARGIGGARVSVLRRLSPRTSKPP